MIPLKKRNVILLILLLLLIPGLLFGPGLARGVRVYGLVSDLLGQAQGSADLTLEGDIALNGQLDWLDRSGRRVFRLTQSGVAFYYCDGVVYLENGKGYDFSEALPDLSAVTDNPWLLFPLTKIDHQEGLWTLRAEEYGLTLNLEEGAAGLEAVDFRLGDRLSGKLTLREAEPMTVPQAILDAIASGEVQAGQDLTGETLRLAAGLADLSSRDPLGLELQLTADCGMLTLDETLTLSRGIVNQTPIHHLVREGQGLYFTDRAACTENGTLLTEQEASIAPSQLLGLVYQLCLNGELSCQGDVYSLTLDQQGMEAFAYAIVPEAEAMNITFRSGTLSLTMTESTIDSIRIHCGGSIDVLLTQLEVSVGAEVRVMEGPSFTVPQAVLDTLIE